MYEGRGELVKAIDMYRESLEMRQQISASDPADVYARGRVAYVHAQLAILHMKVGQLSVARAAALEAVRLNTGLVDIALRYRAQQAEAFLALGRIEAAAGAARAACGSFAESAALYSGLATNRALVADNRDKSDYVAARLAACRARQRQNVRR